MWKCTNCDEILEEEFETCWNCGTDRAGNIDDNFEVILDEQDIRDEEIKVQRIKQVKLEKELQKEIQNILIVTTPVIEQKKIVKYFDMIIQEEVIGTGVFSELSASMNDVLGSSGAYASKFKTVKSLVFNKLKHIAYDLGANAIVGAEVEYSITQTNMIMFSLSGTPVIIKDAMNNNNISTLNEMERIFELKKEGILTEEEFEEKKKILLDKIN